ncbi:uncharacterized protein Z519_03125 [Cladophialophora bantiana CBS 173.52]|uniref:VWFA domain-containing protein n=1 Tax=Cladophialophora bantiana (strain ATCC 10958 / CBS 173.52 / CDC B-1940 / NIH 8579) TaxID=1442370 RepID=A0A0D2IH71_CLAB1|nr:uncharacterized protein Z519_03125 [Cladophialophora bantiana CBS 173.52]KIW96059.1 hypothetical protein Z519_03125 [Cladophialophora bantiana CBS 173.52]
MFPIILSLSFYVLFTRISDAYLLPRDSTSVCTNLRVNSNNGDRKIALVIDSSGSMEESDPYQYRLTAAQMVLDWLISKSEVTSTQKQDKVAVINFDDEAYLDYPLGDPGVAASALTQIGEDGGTYIAGGVEMAITQLTAAGTGTTAGRSGILVFTDGQDSSTSDLVDQINRATSLGIRVAFGFLADPSSIQDPEVLSAIMDSGGRYFTIQNYNASKTFIDGIILNGLAKNDNPDGDTTTLLAGLDAAHFISGSETQTMTYSARSKEQLTFNVQSVDAGTVSVQIVSGSKTLAKGQSSEYSYYSSGYSVIAPSTDMIDVKVTANNAEKKSIFVVGVTSNLPPENCTIGVGPQADDNNVPQIVEGTVGSVVGLLILGGIAYLIYKYCCNRHGKQHQHYHNDHSSDWSHDPKHCPEPTVRETPAANPSATPWFHFPKHPPPMKHHPHNRTTTDNHDHDMDEDSGSEAPTDDHDDIQSPISDPPYHPDNKSPLYHNANPPCQPPYPNQPQYPNQPSFPGQPPNSNQPSYPNQPLNPNQPTNPSQPPSNPPNPDQPPDEHDLHPHPPMPPRTYGNNHHHHIPQEHPCYTKRCPIASASHVCEDPRYPCTCVDPKCRLNQRRHRCRDKDMPHTCVGPDFDPHCPLNDRDYAKIKKEERDRLVRKYVAQDLAKKGVGMVASTATQAAFMGQL